MKKWLHPTRGIILIGLLLSYQAQPSTSQAQPSTFFYEPIQLNKSLYLRRCNCQPNAQCNQQNGICLKEICAPPYIGITCQHINVSNSLTSKPNVPQTLLDGDDSVCLSHLGQTATFEVEPSHFIWVYLYRQLTTPMQPKLVLYHNSGSVDTTFDVRKLNDHSILIKSKRNVMYDTLKVDNLPADLCSLEISLGRNLAISSSPRYEFVSAPEPVQEASEAVDGDDMTLLYIKFVDDGTSNWWWTRLPFEARVNRVRVRSDVSANYGFWAINVRLKTKTSQLENRKIDVQQDVDLITCNVNLKTPVIEVGINVIKTGEEKFKPVNKLGALEEVYIYGDFLCPPNKYGPLCERDRPVSCGGDICDPDWGCPEGCSQTGMDCRFRYGEFCEHDCSDGCANLGECDNLTGRCLFGCNAGYFGPLCQMACPPGMFGVNCSKSCRRCGKNETTDEYSCDPLSGQCLLGCGPGYRGEFCEKLIVVDDIVTKVRDISIVGFIIIAIILIYKSLTTEDEECTEEEIRHQKIEILTKFEIVKPDEEEEAIIEKEVDEQPLEEIIVPLAEPEIIQPEDEINEMPAKSFWENIFGGTTTTEDLMSAQPKSNEEMQHLRNESTPDKPMRDQESISLDGHSSLGTGNINE